MRNKPASILILVLALMFAQPILADDLLGIYQLAQDRDPDLAAFRANLRAMDEARTQTRGRLFPEITLSGDAERRREDREFIDDPVTIESERTQTFNAWGYRLNLAQPLYRGQVYPALRQADARISEADAQVQLARQDLLLRVADRYFEVLAAQDNLEFTEAERDAIGRQLDRAERRLELGLTAVTEVDEAQARFDLAQAEVIQAENRLDNAHDALRDLTGHYHEQVDTLRDEIPLARPDPDDIDAWNDLAEARNVGVQIARHQAEASREEINVARAGRYPSVDLFARHDFDRFEGGQFGGQEVDSSAIGVQLEIPLYAGGRLVSQTREAQHRLTEARERLERERRDALLQTRRSYRGVVSGISRVRALDQAVESNSTALEATRRGLEVGTRTIVDVLDAQRELFRARRDRSEARYDYLLDLLRLRQAAGVLSMADLHQVNNLLE